MEDLYWPGLQESLQVACEAFRVVRKIKSRCFLRDSMGATQGRANSVSQTGKILGEKENLSSGLQDHPIDGNCCVGSLGAPGFCQTWCTC